MIDPVALLSNVFPNIDQKVIAHLARLALIKNYPAGWVLCYEGDRGDTFYMVGSGQIAITKRMSEDEERLLRVLEAGEFFGEMALLHGNAIRSATVKTLVPSTILELDRTTFEGAIEQNPRMVLTLVRTMINRMRANDQLAMDELRRQKEIVEEAYAELKRQEQQRNEFLDTLAHELRTPLTGAKGYIQLVKAGMMTGPALNMAIDKINFSFNRIISLVNDLLFVQEMDLLDFGFSKVDLREVFDEVMEQLSPILSEYRATLRFQFAENLPTILADHDGMVRVFRHLIDNALKFSPEGGEVLIAAYPEAQGVVVDITDQGIGIPPEFMPRLFKRFERIESYEGHLFGGVGLGLPIVKHIVESHGGTITVESTPNEGSTFTIHLPLDARRATTEINIEEKGWVDMPDTGPTLGNLLEE